MDTYIAVLGVEVGAHLQRDFRAYFCATGCWKHGVNEGSIGIWLRDAGGPVLREDILDHASYPQCFCFDGCCCCSTCFPEDSFEGEDRVEGLSAACRIPCRFHNSLQIPIGMRASDSACFE